MITTLAQARPKMNHVEDAECRHFWQWAQYIPELRDCLYHCPNGGQRKPIEAARMKGMGVRAGVSDYNLPIARGNYIGLWIEMKAPTPHKAVVSDSQRRWMENMVFQGHAVFVCYGWIQAKRVCEWYLKQPVIDRVVAQLPLIEELME